jgi:hypothetical protein
MTKWPGPPVGDQLLTAEDLDTLDQLDQCPTDELCQLADEPGGEIVVNTLPAQPCRLLYARLLAELVAPEDQCEVKRVLVSAVEDGRWPTWKYDMKIIRLALLGCGFVPGRPLSERARETFAESERRRARVTQ